MSHIRWPEDVRFEPVVVVSENRSCEHCGGYLYVWDTRYRHVWSLSGPKNLVVQVLHCPNRSCVGHKVHVGTEAELAVSMPYWSLTWDVLAWMGHRRFARHWSVPQIREELKDRFHIAVSSDWVEDYVRRYQAMLAAREADLVHWAADYAGMKDVILTIDGLQPEKGHETLYVVREIRSKRVWFAQPLLSSSRAEVKQLFMRAQQIAAQLGKPVRCWMSDKQDAFVSGVAEVFPGVPHRYCANHFLRDLAKPVLEADSHAKVQMRRKVRGLRKVEKKLLANATAEADTSTQAVAADAAEADAERRQIALDYSAAIRGILNDDQGGPLHPPGLRMAAALDQVGQSIQRSLLDKKGGRALRH